MVAEFGCLGWHWSTIVVVWSPFGPLFALLVLYSPLCLVSWLTFGLYFGSLLRHVPVEINTAL